MGSRLRYRVPGAIVVVIASALLVWTWSRALRGDASVFRGKRGDLIAPLLLAFGVACFWPAFIEENEALRARGPAGLTIPGPGQLVRSLTFWVLVAGLAASVVHGVLIGRLGPGM